MVQNSSDLMQALVESRQAELRKSGRPLLPNHEAGAFRTRLGRAFIRLGERIGGAHPTQVQPAAARSLATP